MNQDKHTDDQTDVIHKSSKWTALLSFWICYGLLSHFLWYIVGSDTLAHIIGLLVACIVSVCSSRPYGKRYVRYSCLALVIISAFNAYSSYHSVSSYYREDASGAMTPHIITAVLAFFAFLIIRDAEE